jgi:hypothetical protein
MPMTSNDNVALIQSVVVGLALRYLREPQDLWLHDGGTDTTVVLGAHAGGAF